MATVEVPTARDEPPIGSAVYDAFISYSHAADDLLAPRLQGGLQRFAKPSPALTLAMSSRYWPSAIHPA